ncbi:MAG: hypothetical protein HOV94_33320 [Saccharothrix sp.]|nr:hypothetical protein [Saccharothrix sp.]
MGAVPGWLRIGVPVLVLLLIGALLIWLIGSFLGFIVKLLVGSVIVVGFVALVHRGRISDRV